MRQLLALWFAASVAFAQAPATLGEAADRLKEALATDATADAQSALAAIPALHAAASDAERKQALDAVGKAAKSDDLGVRHGAFAALGAMKMKGSSKYLGRWLNPPKSFKGEIPPSYLEAIRAAGAIADAGTLSKLEDLSDHGELTIAVAATQALGGFHTLPTKRRKALAIDLVDRLERLSAQQRRKASEEVYARKAALAAATVAALRQLTGKDYQTLDGWKAWKEKAEKEADPFGP